MLLTRIYAPILNSAVPDCSRPKENMYFLFLYSNIRSNARLFIRIVWTSGYTYSFWRGYAQRKSYTGYEPLRTEWTLRINTQYDPFETHNTMAEV